MKLHNYILIMAGGGGTRLYPKSRESNPKQFQQIIGSSTLLEQTYARAVRIVSPQNIFISSNQKYISKISKLLPELPKANIILEPSKKNTAPAMGLAIATIQKIDPKAIVASIHSDHLVLKTDVFVKTFTKGFNTVLNHNNQILCIGIKPTSAHTGYGYIEKSNVEIEKNIFSAIRFVEKPNSTTASEYVKSGNFFWNAGYFIMTAKHFLSELEKYNPGIISGISKIIRNISNKNYLKILIHEYDKMPDIAVDTAVMERTENMLILPESLGWSDIGSWDSVIDMLNTKKDKFGNYSQGLSSFVDCHKTTIMSDYNNKLIAAIGLDNMIVVSSDDVLLITPRGRSEEVKKIVEDLKSRKLNNFL